jgi:hypothetical protein
MIEGKLDATILAGSVQLRTTGMIGRRELLVDELVDNFSQPGDNLSTPVDELGHPRGISIRAS